MKKMLLLMGALFGGAAAGLFVGLILPPEKRARLSQPFVARCGRMLDRIPDE